MNAILRQGLSAGLLALALTAAAEAQPAAYVYQGPDGPTVLQVDVANRPIVPPGRPDLAGPAIPVPQVMNGGGFGLTGNNYFDEGRLEGQLNGRQGSRTYILVPAWAERRPGS